MIDNYSKLPLGKYLEIRSMLKEEMDDLEMQSRIIAILEDRTQEEVLAYKVSRYQESASAANFLTIRPNVKAECPSKIKLGDRTYTVLKKADKMCAGQYIDYQTYMKMEDPDGQMDKILSIFVIPEGKTYNEGYDIEEVQEDIREHMPVSVALGIAFFLRKRSARLQRRSLTFLTLMLTIMMKKEKNQEQRKMLEETVRKIRELRDLQKDMAG